MSNDNICPICFENTGTLLKLSCSHCIHVSCAVGLTNRQCPYCRTNVKNWPSYLKKIIDKNKEKRDREIEEEIENTTIDIIFGDDLLHIIRSSLEFTLGLALDENIGIIIEDIPNV